MEIQQLRHFLAAVKYGNIGRAAAELGITQSGLSRSIRNLEIALDVRLLTRGAQGVEPTQYGYGLIPRAQAMLNEQERAVEELRRIGSEKSGLLRLGITSNFISNFAPGLMLELLRTQPQLDLAVTSGTFDQLLGLLRAGELDLLLGLVNYMAVLDDFVLCRLYVSHSTVVCPAFHPLAGKARVTIEDLANAHWVMPISAGLQKTFESFFHASGHYRPRQVMKTNSASFLRQTLLAMPLLSIMTREQSEPDVRDGLLRRLECEAPGSTTTAAVLYRGGMTITPGMRELIDAARRHAAKREAALGASS